MTPAADTLARHRLTADAYTALAEAQGGLCAICQHTSRDCAHANLNCQHANYARPLFVDHDHVCCGPSNTRRTCGNCIRGLLCSGCNGFLGLLELNGVAARRRRPEWVAAARAYLHAAGCDPDAPYRRLVLREQHLQRMTTPAHLRDARTRCSQALARTLAAPDPDQRLVDDLTAVNAYLGALLAAETMQTGDMP